MKKVLRSVRKLPGNDNEGGQSLPFVVMPAGAALLGIVFCGGIIGAAVGGAIGLTMAIMDLRSVKRCHPKS